MNTISQISFSIILLETILEIYNLTDAHKGNAQHMYIFRKL
jgi:hypothetical protein